MAAHAHAEQRVARVGNGLEISWKPAPDPSAIAPLAPLEGASLKPAAWVFPPSDQADTMLVNPVYPPDYQDAIVWFPGLAHRAPVYVSINVRLPETGEIHSVG
ncbi:S-type pyocin domain-containing protein [Pseudomonas lundensis]|uniref:S-type pyocin domain-containing protein n=1 Tax=Pseudomonas lundensis TaxID=86185 RepID=UPI00201D98EE|nr:S-type pyocin domain-containing protein [Pseudomonas lundensis]